MGNAVTGGRVIVAWFVLSSMAILVAAEPTAGTASLPDTGKPDAGKEDPAKRVGITRADLAASYLRLEAGVFCKSTNRTTGSRHQPWIRSGDFGVLHWTQRASD